MLQKVLLSILVLVSCGHVFGVQTEIAADNTENELRNAVVFMVSKGAPAEEKVVREARPLARDMVKTGVTLGVLLAGAPTMTLLDEQDVWCGSGGFLRDHFFECFNLAFPFLFGGYSSLLSDQVHTQRTEAEKARWTLLKAKAVCALYAVGLFTAARSVEAYTGVNALLLYGVAAYTSSAVYARLCMLKKQELGAYDHYVTTFLGHSGLFASFGSVVVPLCKLAPEGACTFMRAGAQVLTSSWTWMKYQLGV